MLVFVYGTLKKGHCRHNFLADQRFVGDAVTKPLYRLVDLGPFPGLVRASGHAPVSGEVYEIDDECRRVLDRVEGAPNLYRLEPIRLEGLDDVHAYFYQTESQ